MEILKATFGPRTAPDAPWQVRSLAGLKARPGHGAGSGLSPLLEDMHFPGGTSFGPVSYYLGQSIVPIVALLDDKSRMKCIGTGFFVSCTGLLITAAHVLTDPIEGAYAAAREVSDRHWQSDQIELGVMVPTHPIFERAGYVFRRIEWGTFLAERTESFLPFAGSRLKLNADIGICKVNQPDSRIPYQPLTMIQRGIRGLGTEPGKIATAIGYGALEDHVALEAVDPATMQGDFPFGLHVSTGSVLEQFPDNAASFAAPSPGPCFSASMPIPPGMSGSPIFDHEGIYVHGVVSMGLSDDKGPTDHAYGSMLSHALGLPIKPLGGKSLSDLIRASTDGIVVLQGPGDI